MCQEAQYAVFRWSSAHGRFTPPPPSDRDHEPLISSCALIKTVGQTERIEFTIELSLASVLKRQRGEEIEKLTRQECQDCEILSYRFVWCKWKSWHIFTYNYLLKNDLTFARFEKAEPKLMNTCLVRLWSSHLNYDQYQFEDLDWI